MSWRLASSNPFNGGFALVSGACWAGDLSEFLAVGLGDIDEVILRSADGINWTARSSPFDGGQGLGVVRAEALGLYVVVGNDPDATNAIITSPDHVTWTGRGNPFNADDANNGTCVAVKPSTGALVAGGNCFGAPDNPLATSSNGTAWTSRSSPFDSGLRRVNGVDYSPTHNRWIAVGRAFGYIGAYSDNDGTTWTALPTDPFTSPEAMNGVYYDATTDQWIVTGSDDSGATVSVSGDNGATWTMLNSPIDNIGFAAIRAGTIIGMAGAGVANMAVSSDGGATWAADSTPVLFDDQSDCFAYSPSLGRAVVGGEGSHGSLAYGLPRPTSTGPPPGISLAPVNNIFDLNPDWTRLDTIPGLNITQISIVRGRPDERSKTSPASISVRGKDIYGALDPTNPNGPLYGYLDPVKQAAITIYNPYLEAWKWLFRGYTSDLTLSFDTDSSENFFDFEFMFTDMLDLLNDGEVIPDSAGNLAPTENVGDTFYTGQHVDDRLLAVLADASTAFYQQIWPAEMLEIASGNVFDQGRAYSNQTSLLQVIDEACDSESPYATNRFITKDGKFAFRGRYYRYVPDFFTAFDGNRRPNHQMLQWDVVDVSSYSTGSQQVIAQNITFTRGKTDLINAALITPANIRQDQIAGQAVHDSTSIGEYGPRTSGMSLENLITSDADDGNNSIQECKTFAQAIVDNYKNPLTRVSQLKFTNPANNLDDEGMNIWHMLTEIELSDLIHIYTHHPGGGGFIGDGYYVEQITYDLEPLQGDVWQVQLTLDLSPQAHYEIMPDSWKPPVTGGVNANFTWSNADTVVTFTDTSTPGPSGPITAWAWSFGDGGTSALQNPVHTYPFSGRHYAVTLTVTGTGPDGTDSTSEGVILV